MDIDILAQCGKMVTYNEGQSICREGEAGHSMFVMIRGGAQVLINSFSDHPTPIDSITEGAFFGEMSLLEGRPRSASVVAISDNTMVLEISENDFPMLLLNANSITFRLLQTLNYRLNSMLDKIEPDDKRFVFQYKKNPIYQTVQKLDVRSFDNVSKKGPDYVWELLKYLSSSLERLNREYISRNN